MILMLRAYLLEAVIFHGANRAIGELLMIQAAEWMNRTSRCLWETFSNSILYEPHAVPYIAIRRFRLSTSAIHTELRRDGSIDAACYSVSA